MEQKMVVARVLDAPREKVFQVWTDPEMIKKWWGPKYFTAPFAEVDFRVGGKYLYCMRGAAGPGAPVRDYWSGGVFREIVAPEKIVVTDYFADEKGNPVSASHYGMNGDIPAEMELIVTFEQQDGKTKITLNYPNLGNMPSPDRVGMEQGWNESLDKLAEVLKSA